MGGRQKLTIEHARTQGDKRQIDCLSSTYTRKIDLLQWRCRRCGYE